MKDNVMLKKNKKKSKNVQRKERRAVKWERKAEKPEIWKLKKETRKKTETQKNPGANYDVSADAVIACQQPTVVLCLVD